MPQLSRDLPHRHLVVLHHLPVQPHHAEWSDAGACTRRRLIRLARQVAQGAAENEGLARTGCAHQEDRVVLGRRQRLAEERGELHALVFGPG